jgi:DNA-binding HxlR family transcriptional regulator
MEKNETTELHPYDKACISRLNAISDALYAIGGKWKLRIIVILKERRGRFNELQRTITGISSKVLASELRELELNGFVKRHALPQTPSVVEYELTEYALTLEPVLEALREWGTMHREKIRHDMKEKSES